VVLHPALRKTAPSQLRRQQMYEQQIHDTNAGRPPLPCRSQRIRTRPPSPSSQPVPEDMMAPEVPLQEEGTLRAVVPGATWHDNLPFFPAVAFFAFLLSTASFKSKALKLWERYWEPHRPTKMRQCSEIVERPYWISHFDDSCAASMCKSCEIHGLPRCEFK
jgi:hypothetical protein